ncbi:Ribonuclease T2 precursor (RNase T2) [Friedmanniomyces endolithicus]|uniref:Ribonuclease T2-like n=1 Tax=Friedmanniomyces endolithicus TaxID=329885 RepID=A0A4U0VGS7_9PEZI|nr:Ribonuclease T2 precursor (RNase T2) [Friedmanniomyces endolithicus]KAK0271254.1 Ribonuclease T2 precursor (RNase T2) [Friedmanniomyces endolithicus]KAK0277346.1 Ribonuclease T2 precursor (RNase T2) [Friedmanniomyces endolithicus]KAK0926787.1 Ribonuclease T2 precursor (RNase T2) [Friedmanniomyces endolithicus]KAK0962730.1 Ribonuclease T2 precursor (RNase T2) [Friedmanniomyces endolithicus]
MAQVDEVHNGLASHFDTGWSDITDNMPSIRSLFAFGLSALANVQSVFGLQNAVTRQFSQDLSASATCTSPQLSCHNTSAVADLCCFNAPGGELLQTQFWDTAPVTGPSDSWTIHGLWPDNCDGTYDSSCDPSRAYTNITQILQAAGANDLVSYMQTYWVSNSGTPESFWEHEWSKHGTCISTLDPNCYTSYQPTEEVPDFFNRTVNLFKSLPSYEWLSEAGIVPSSSATYTTAQIQAALSKNRGGHQVYLGCQSGALNEIWYFFNVQGSIQTGTFEASDLVGSKSTCPSTGIKYLPKGNGGGSSPTSAAPLPDTSTTASLKPSTTKSSGPSTTTSAAPSPTSGGPSFSGKGTLNVITSGSQTGCIISGGTWYTSGTCAGFTATTSDDGFTLSSRKGDCAIVGGALTCGSSVDSATSFSADGDLLVYDGAANFSADGVPSGSTQGTVYTGEDHSTSLTIQWQGL